MLYLYISTIGKDVSWIDSSIPVEVGAACRSTFIYPCNKDNTGDNISIDNAYWGELTALYWIWKNVRANPDDIIGFGHYNKHLSVNNKEVESILKDNQWIVCKPTTMVAHSYPEDISVLETILERDFKEYYPVWKELYNSDGSSRCDFKNCSNCELFFTRFDEFNSYCSFIFAVLFRLRQHIGDVDRTPYHNRYCAFIGERLLSVYLIKNKLASVCVETKYNESMFHTAVRKLLVCSGILESHPWLRNIKAMIYNGRKSSYK